MRIFHAALAYDWQEAQRAGAYSMSTRGVTLAEEGFIHASRSDQWADTIDRFYADVRSSIVLLEIETDRLTSPWREDPVGDTSFPHIYGPLNLDAVVAVRTPGGDLSA